MIKQLLILAILPASAGASAACMTDRPEIGDIALAKITRWDRGLRIALAMFIGSGLTWHCDQIS